MPGSASRPDLSPHHHFRPPTAFPSSSAAAPAAGPSSSSAASRRMPPPPMDGHYPDLEPPSAPPLTGDPSFDILDWHPAYQSCQRYFLDHAQHEPGTQALCALVNIRLPFQHLTHPITTSTPPETSSTTNPTYSFNFPRAGSVPAPPRNAHSNHPNPDHPHPHTLAFVSLIPYIRRLVVTGFDKPPILHGFFGDDFERGILPHLDCERRNYLFAAKHGGWRTCKKQYDEGCGLGGAGGDESVPFMKPLDEAKREELGAAEKAWSSWLAMEDWMVGPNAPVAGDGGGSGSSSGSGSAARGGSGNDGGGGGSGGGGANGAGVPTGENISNGTRRPAYSERWSEL